MSHDNNATQAVHQQPRREFDAETDFSALLKAIWGTRKWMFVAALLTALCGLAILALGRGAIPSSQTYQTAIRFVFPGVETGTYPNGAPFAPSDLLAPVVLQGVYEGNDLKKHGIRLATFISSISIHPFSPAYSAALKRYSTRLANKRLSFVERKTIELEMREELEALVAKNALLRLGVTGRVGLSGKMAEKLLNDVVVEWAKFSIEQQGVLKLPDQFVENELLDKTVLLKQEPVVVSEQIFDRISSLKNRLLRFGAMPGANTISDKENGQSLNSLLRNVRNLEQFRLTSVNAAIIEGHSFINRNRAVEIMKLRAEANELLQEKYKKNAASISQSLAIYANRSSASQGKGTDQAVSGKLPATGQVSASPQLSQGFIDRLISLVQGDKDVIYRQQLVDRQIVLKSKAVQSEIDGIRIRKLIARIEKSEAGLGNNNVDEALVRQLGTVIDEVNLYNTIAGRLFEALGSKRISHNSRLYKQLELTAGQRASSYHPLWNMQALFLVLALALGAAILAMFAGLLRTLMKA